MSFDLKLQDGNLVISKNGDIETVTNTDKLVQDVTKLAITPIGANKMHSWYGSGLGKTLIGAAFDLDFAKQLSSQQLFSAIETLRTLQISQAQQQNVSASEAISRILNVSIEHDKIDPRLIRVFIAVLSRSAKRSIIPLTVDL
jgi:hypothetical protein